MSKTISLTLPDRIFEGLAAEAAAWECSVPDLLKLHFYNAGTAKEGSVLKFTIAPPKSEPVDLLEYAGVRVEESKGQA